jgi:hypothetical protein
VIYDASGTEIRPDFSEKKLEQKIFLQNKIAKMKNKKKKPPAIEREINKKNDNNNEKTK